jgi:hypothetical protein
VDKARAGYAAKNFSNLFQERASGQPQLWGTILNNAGARLWEELPPGQLHGHRNKSRVDAREESDYEIQAGWKEQQNSLSWRCPDGEQAGQNGSSTI